MFPAQLHRVDAVVAQTLPSTFRWRLVTWLNGRRLCHCGCCPCYGIRRFRRWLFGTVIAPGSTIPWVIYIWCGSTIAFQASISRADKNRCEFITAPQASVTRAIWASDGRLPNCMWFWLMLRLIAISLSDRHVVARCMCVRQRWRQSMLSTEGARAPKALDELLEYGPSWSLGCRIIITAAIFAVCNVPYIMGVDDPLVTRINVTAIWKCNDPWHHSSAVIAILQLVLITLSFSLSRTIVMVH